MLTSIDIVFCGPQIRIPYIMIIVAMHAYISVPNLLSMISMKNTSTLCF
jgi:hypothetical protein